MYLIQNSLGEFLACVAPVSRTEGKVLWTTNVEDAIGYGNNLQNAASDVRRLKQYRGIDGFVVAEKMVPTYVRVSEADMAWARKTR